MSEPKRTTVPIPREPLRASDASADVAARIEALQRKKDYGKAKKTQETKQELALVDLSTITPRDVEWVWQNRIPRGALTLVVGDPDVGKSYITTDISARITRGAELPEDGAHAIGDVILCNYEDAADTTIRPRADRATFGPGKIYVVDEEHLFTARDMGKLKRAIQSHPDVVLVIIDPVGSYIGGKVEAGQDNQVRSVLSPLAKMAQDHDIAVLCNMHMNKGDARKAIYRVAGSIAGFVGVARSVLLVGIDAQTSKRGIVQIRNANGPYATAIEFALSAQGVDWRGENDELTADRLTADENRRGHTGKEIKAWLREKLEGRAPQKGKPILDEAEKLDYSLSTVHRIASEIGVQKYQDRNGSTLGPVMWFLEPRSLNGK